MLWLALHLPSLSLEAFCASLPHQPATAGLGSTPVPVALVAELADAEARVLLARRFHNDAVRDTLALRERRPVRWLRRKGLIDRRLLYRCGWDRSSSRLCIGIHIPLTSLQPKLTGSLFQPAGLCTEFLASRS